MADHHQSKFTVELGAKLVKPDGGAAIMETAVDDFQVHSSRDSKGLRHSSHESRVGRRSRDSKALSHSYHHDTRRIPSQKNREKAEGHSSRRRHLNRENSRSSSHRRRSSERPSAESSDRRRSTRHKYSRSRPSRTKSFDDISFWETTHEIENGGRQSTEADDLQIVGRKISKEKSQRRRRRRSRDSNHDHHDCSQSTAATDALYGDNEEDAKAKMRASRGASERSMTPGVEHIGSRGNRTMNTLYGKDSNTKEKAMGASYERTTNRVEQVDNNHQMNRSLHTLYGSDADAKAKAKASVISSEPAKTPGVHQVSSTIAGICTISSSNHSTATSTLSVADALYGNDAGAIKAKASCRSSEPATFPGTDRVFSHTSSPVRQKAKFSRGSLEQKYSPSARTMNTLYGDDNADTKAKTKSSRGSNRPASNPGVETVTLSNSTHSAISSLYGGSEAQAKVKASASRGFSDVANNPGAESVVERGRTDSTVGTLYGHDADSKAKDRVGSSLLAAFPGVERLRMRSPSASDSSDEHTQNEVQEPVARRVSTGSTDSESLSGPVHKSRTSSEATEGFQIPNYSEASAPEQRGSLTIEAVEDTSSARSRKKRKKLIVILLLILLLIGGGAAVWYFLFRNTSSGEAGLSSANTNIQEKSEPTSSPTGTGFSPNAGPSTLIEDTTFSPSEIPSAPPSRGLAYQPPSKVECQAIAVNQTIAGREEMENADFELVVEVVLPGNRTLTEPLLQALLDAIQRKILPSLAGCSVIIDELVEAWRFVIFDAFVTGSVPPDESCTDKALMQLNCHRVSVKLNLFLKGAVRFLDIIALISDEGENIANHLELDDIFSIIKLIGAESLVPTDAPTRMPSATPSFSPTEFPTVLASSNPTAIPSGLPTRAPTGEPSRFPTIVPSVAPSMVPSTTAPSADPSVQPTGVPSESPSVRPTNLFSGSPTSPPTPAPSSRPSVTPTQSPSLMPSQLPSIPPTDGPSLSPSDSPTNFPTLAPSSTPSTSPSRSPTQIPITPAPTYAVEIITQAHGPYTNYPVSQSTTGWGGAAKLAIDGNNSGAYNFDRSVTHTLHRLGQWWQVDLATGAGRPVVVKHITVWNRADCCTDRLIGAVVQLLDANQNDITPSNIDNVLPDARETTIDYGLVPNVSFVKISKDYIISLAEVEIFGYVPI